MLTLIFQRHAEHDGQADLFRSMADQPIERKLRPDYVMMSSVPGARESAEAEIAHFREGGHKVEGPVVVDALDKDHEADELFYYFEKVPDGVQTILCISDKEEIVWLVHDLMSREGASEIFNLNLGPADAVVLRYFNTEGWRDVDRDTFASVEPIPAPR